MDYYRKYNNIANVKRAIKIQYILCLVIHRKILYYQQFLLLYSGKYYTGHILLYIFLRGCTILVMYKNLSAGEKAKLPFLRYYLKLWWKFSTIGPAWENWSLFALGTSIWTKIFWQTSSHFSHAVESDENYTLSDKNSLYKQFINVMQ